MQMALCCRVTHEGGTFASEQEVFRLRARERLPRDDLFGFRHLMHIRLYAQTHIARWGGSCISHRQVLNDEPCVLVCPAHTVTPIRLRHDGCET